MIGHSKLFWRTGIKYSNLTKQLSSLKKSTSNQKTLLKLCQNNNSFVYLSSSVNSNNHKETNTNLRNALVAIVGALGINKVNKLNFESKELILKGIGYFTLNDNRTYCQELEQEPEITPGLVIDSLPTFTEDDLKKHNKDSDRIWVSYKNGIYDITDFIDSHPGGQVLLAAAGGSIEPFWQIYAVHHSQETYSLLEELRIGNLKQEVKKVDGNDPFSTDPKRNSLLKVLSVKPFNAESPKELSVESLLTPNELHFKRNHLPVPHVNIDEFELEIIDDLTKKSYKFKLADLKTKYPIHTVPVTIQCSGNRRKLMNDYEPVQGLMWDVNAISTAEWTGVKLVDLLKECQINFDDNKIRHVQFEGLDKGPTGVPYGASVPKEKVFDLNGDVLVAFKMNGVDIPLDHGFPLRVVIPGVVGARSVKWLNKVIVSNEESKSHWQQNDYKVLPVSVKDLKEADFSKLKAVQECPVQSAICQPIDGAIIEKSNETIKLKGYAYSGGGKEIDNVIISIDGGQTWQNTKIKQLDRPMNRSWSWAIWEYELAIPQDKTSLDIICVATDSAHNTQPETCKAIWNARGVMNNAWHKIHVELK